MLSITTESEDNIDIVFSPSYNVDQLSPIKCNVKSNQMPLWKNNNLNTFTKSILRDESREDLFSRIREITEKSIIVEYERKNKQISKNDIDLLIDNAFKYNNFNNFYKLFMLDIKKYIYSKFSFKICSEESSVDV